MSGIALPSSDPTPRPDPHPNLGITSLTNASSGGDRGAIANNNNARGASGARPNEPRWRSSYESSKETISRITSISESASDVPVKVHIFGSDDEEIDFNAIIIAPDGGWGWVVLFAAFCSMFKISNAFSEIAVRLQTFLFELGKETGKYPERTQMLWIPSIFTAFTYLGGPLASVLINRLGCRETAIIGSVISTMAVLISFTLSLQRLSLTTLYVCNGFLNGLGYSLVYMSAIVMAAFYFEKYRGLATCIVLSGYPVSRIVSPKIVGWTDRKFGWGVGMVIGGAFTLLCAVAACLYRPLSVVPPAEDWDDRTEPEGLVPLVESSISQDESPRHSKQSVTHVEDLVGLGQGHDSPGRKVQLGSAGLIQSSTDLQSRKSVGWDDSTFHTQLGHSTLELDGSSRKLRLDSADKLTVNNLLGRDDIFYAGDMKRIPMYDKLVKRGSISKQEWKAMLSSMPKQKMSPKRKMRMCHKELSIISKMFSFRLFKSFTFILLTTLVVFAHVGTFIMQVQLLDRMETVSKLSPDKRKTIMNVMGGTNLVGRIICGVIADQPRIPVSYMYCLSLLVAGVSASLVPFLGTFEHYICVAVVFGLTTSVYESLTAVVQVDLVGLENFTNAFGLMHLFIGTGYLFGLPCSELVGGKDNIGRPIYPYAFYLAGALLFTAGIVAFPIKWVSEWEMTIHGLLKP